MPCTMEPATFIRISSSLLDTYSSPLMMLFSRSRPVAKVAACLYGSSWLAYGSLGFTPASRLASSIATPNEPRVTDLRFSSTATAAFWVLDTNLSHRESHMSRNCLNVYARSASASMQHMYRSASNARFQNSSVRRRSSFSFLTLLRILSLNPGHPYSRHGIIRFRVVIMSRMDIP